MDKLNTVLTEFWGIVDRIYGVYLDGVLGFGMLREDIIAHEEEARKEFGQNVEVRRSYPRYVPAGQEHKRTHLHEATSEDLKKRNAIDGTNTCFIAKMCIVLIYQYWEDNYRRKIAECLGLEGINSKDRIQSSVFSDIRRIRQSIIHHRGLANKEVSRCKLFTWFNVGDEIYLDQNKVGDIIDAIRDFLEAFKNNPKAFCA